MGALAHYLEAAGIPTTQISLIREHTVAIKPPRALWVPFALGRPLGIPGDAAFQRRVLLATLELLTLPADPVLMDFPDEAPEPVGAARQSLEQLACPVSFSPSQGESETEKLLSAFRREITEFRSWYDMGLAKRGYSAVAYLGPAEAEKLVSAFILGNPLELPGTISSPAMALRLAAQDLKAFYFEAVLFRPATSLPGEAEFNRWFWQTSAAGKVFKLVRDKCLGADDEELRMTGSMLLVPMDQA